MRETREERHRHDRSGKACSEAKCSVHQNEVRNEAKARLLQPECQQERPALSGRTNREGSLVKEGDHAYSLSANARLEYASKLPRN